jgi:hypothetical protein
MFYINDDALDAFWKRHHYIHKFGIIVLMIPLAIFFSMLDGLGQFINSAGHELNELRQLFHWYTPKKEAPKDNFYHV